MIQDWQLLALNCNEKRTKCPGTATTLVNSKIGIRKSQIANFEI
jgi:hypothetical protein